MKKAIKKNRKFWFKFYKLFLRLFFYRPKFVFLGDEFDTRSIILSNHVGALSPVTLELYQKKLLRFWGTHEMNDGLISSYKYLSTLHFNIRKGYSVGLSKFLGFIGSPLTTIFYKGLRLIPTYQNVRLKNAIHESLDAIKEGQNIVIFPENITRGYNDILTEFHAGFLVLAEKAYKLGYDLPIYVAYYQKKKRVYIFDKKIMFSELYNSKLSRNEICALLCNRCNELGQMKIK